MERYRVAVFAHNDAPTIAATVESIRQSFSRPPDDLKIFVVVNGSTDGTPEVVRDLSRRYAEIVPIEIAFGDKCNAWNTFVHGYLDERSVCHFFMDSDVTCSPGALELMTRRLQDTPEARAIGGLPMSGRKREYYRKIALQWHWLYGNLYAVRTSHLQKVAAAGVRLPLGLRGNDHVITRVVKSDIGGDWIERDEWLIHDDRAGYEFPSLQPFRWRDIRVYTNRMVIYEWRRRQLLAIDIPPWPLSDLPRDMDFVNRRILKDLNDRLLPGDVIGWALRKRLRRMYPSGDSAFYGRAAQASLAVRNTSHSAV